jgi:hypothetical protein
MIRRVQGVRTAGKSRDLLRFDDAEIVETDKPQPKSSFSTGCQARKCVPESSPDSRLARRSVADYYPPHKVNYEDCWNYPGSTCVQSAA